MNRLGEICEEDDEDDEDEEGEEEKKEEEKKKEDSVSIASKLGESSLEWVKEMAYRSRKTGFVDCNFDEPFDADAYW